MPTWLELAWSGVFYKTHGDDAYYQRLIQNSTFLSSLRTIPTSVTANDVCQYLIKGYLNAWKSHVHNSTQSANAILASINNLLPWLSALSGQSIKSVNFLSPLSVNSQNTTVAYAVEQCYLILRQTGYNVGPTATGKILHILNPELFVMWDGAIIKYYKGINGSINNTSKGYLAFLQLMIQFSIMVENSFQSALLNPVKQQNDTSEGYLSRALNYGHPKTMAKYLDEYNWITITNKVQVPPRWHP